MTSPSRPSAATDATSTATDTDASGAIETLANFGEGLGVVILKHLVREDRKAEFEAITEAIVAAAEVDLRSSIETVQAGADLRADELAATQTASALAHADLGYTVLNVQAEAASLFEALRLVVTTQEKQVGGVKRLVGHIDCLLVFQEKLQADFKAEQAAQDAKIAAQDAEIAALRKDVADLCALFKASGRFSVQEGQQE